ncbi:cytochrome C [Ferrimonas aestuarii]|uniref:Cytochrome C n=1 Tax=Ferrimonas aestuarii TaxID=2569539 RepID=A0A4U1BRK0_9GAMM|nr:cytochrome C [Ferrimonas aestuarii]TKB57400.1 cytochrome C [Ferrimonas aestuarii]
MDRRNALKNIIGMTTCAAGAAVVPNMVLAAEESWQFAPEDANTLAWTKVDPMEVAKISYQEAVRTKGCMYQVFHALVTAQAQAGGPDADKFAAIPTALSMYGSGGIYGLGTVCGNNNAAGMFFKLISINGNKPSSMEKVSAYYQNTMLPYNDAEFLTALGVSQADFDANVVVQTKAESLLCHASLTRWCEASGKAVATKGMRCQLLSASIAYHIAEILNQELETGDVSDLPGYENVSQCVMCHTKAEDSMGTSVMAGMECDTCHGN